MAGRICGQLLDGPGEGHASAPSPETRQPHGLPATLRLRVPACRHGGLRNQPRETMATKPRSLISTARSPMPIRYSRIR